MISLIAPATVRQMCELASTTPPGAFVEVGVYQGGSAVQLADVAIRQNRALHLFDTFCGIPFAEDGDSHSIGDFADTSAAQVQTLIPSAILHVGAFPQTMPAQFGPVAFLHIDADQYRSYVDAIKLFTPLMVPGGVMWFDDYDCLDSANRAVDELLGARVVSGEFPKAIARF